MLGQIICLNSSYSVSQSFLIFLNKGLDITLVYVLVSSIFREFDSELKTSVEAHKLQCLRVYGDGCCIVESVRQCFGHVEQALNSNMMLNEIKNETLYHIAYSKRFLSLKTVIQ